MSSCTRFLLDQNLWIPADSPEGQRAKLELQYSVSRPTKTNPSGVVKMYQERDGYVLAPRHYLDYTEIDCEWVGPREFPILEEKCFVEPYGETSEAADVQRDAFAFLGNYGVTPAHADSIVSLRCGGGKSFIGMRGAFDLGHHTLIVAHTKDLLNNWRNELLEFTSLKETGGVISGTYDLQPVTLALIQSLLALPPEKLDPIRQRFGTIIIDEMHHLSGTEFSAIGNAFPGRRIGLSATLAREDGLSFVYYLALGQNIFYREMNRLKADVFFRRVHTNDVDFPENYARAVTTLASSNDYMSAIEADIRSAYRSQQKQLIIANRKDMLKGLQERLSDLDVGLNVSETKDEERHSNLHTKPITLAIDILGKEGLSEPNLTQLRVLTPVKDPNALVQMVGRLERGDKTMQAFFYASWHGPFQRTLHKAKEALVRNQYRVREADV